MINVVEPEISWIDGNVTIPEGSGRELCFVSNIGTAQPYDVSVAVRGKGDDQASGIYHVCTSERERKRERERERERQRERERERDGY